MSRLNQFLEMMTEQNALLKDHLDRIETQHEKLTESVQGLNDALVGLTHSQKSFYEKQEDTKRIIEKMQDKNEKLDERLRLVEQAVGVNSVFSDISKDKIKNLAGWLIGAAVLAYTIIKDSLGA